MERLGLRDINRDNKAKIDLATGKLRIFDDKEIKQEYCELFLDDGDILIKLTDKKNKHGRGVHRYGDAIMINLGYRVVRDLKLDKELFNFEITNDSIRIFL